jgi:hypothetical protein
MKRSFLFSAWQIIICIEDAPHQYDVGLFYSQNMNTICNKDVSQKYDASLFYSQNMNTICNKDVSHQYNVGLFYSHNMNTICNKDVSQKYEAKQHVWLTFRNVLFADVDLAYIHGFTTGIKLTPRLLPRHSIAQLPFQRHA